MVARKTWAITIGVMMFTVISAPDSEEEAYKGTNTCQASMNRITKVTCHFYTNLNVSKENFMLLYYKPNNDDPNVMLSCNWDGAVPNCFKAKEVTFDKVVTFQLTATMTSKMVEVGGQFACQVVPSTYTQYVKCYVLNVSEDEVTTSTTTFSSQITQAPPTSCPIQGGTLAAVILLTILLTAALGFIFYLLRTGTNPKELLPTRCLSEMREVSQKDDQTA